MNEPSADNRPDEPSSEDGSEFGSGRLAPEVSRRVSSILDAVEQEAASLRAEAREEAGRYLEYSRRHADELVAERQARIGALSDELMSKAEAVVARLDDAAPVRAGFENLIKALGDAAERLAGEAERTRDAFGPPPFHGGDPVEGQSPPPRGPDPAQAPPAGAGYSPPPRAPVPTPQAPHPAEGAPPLPEPMQPHPARAAEPQPATPPPQQPEPPATYPGTTYISEPEQPQPAVSGSSAGRPNYGGPQPGATPTDVGALDDARRIAIQMAAAGSTRHQVREHLTAALGLTGSGEILDEIYGADSSEHARVPWTAFPR